MCLPNEQGTNLPNRPGRLPNAPTRLLIKRQPCRISIPSDTSTEETEIGTVRTDLGTSNFLTEQTVSSPFLKENKNLKIRDTKVPHVPSPRGQCREARKAEQRQETNRVVRLAKAHTDLTLPVCRIPAAQICLVSYGDASGGGIHAEQAQTGYTIMFADMSLLAGTV